MPPRVELVSSAYKLNPRIVGLPTVLDLEWLCAHPDHSLIMIEIDEVFVPMIVDANGKGPVIPTAE